MQQVELARVKAEVTAFLVRHGLAEVEPNAGLACTRGPEAVQVASAIGPQLRSFTGYRVQSAAHQRVYAAVDEFSLQTLFVAYPLAGETRVANFTLPGAKMSTYAQVSVLWRQFGKAHGRPPETLTEVAPIFACLSRCLSRELRGMEVPDTPRNKLKLLNLHMAYDSNRLYTVKRGKSAWAHELLAWLDADVDIEHLLYAFDRHGGWNWRQGVTAVPLAEVQELRGVPLGNIRALYPQVR